MATSESTPPSVVAPAANSAVAQPDVNTSTVSQEFQQYEIPEEGSLGLLAMGYVGIMLWRDKKRQGAQLKITVQGSE